MKPVLFTALLLTAACQSHDKPATSPTQANTRPHITEGGRLIEYPAGAAPLGYFQTEAISPRSLSAQYQAPAHVVATVVATPGVSRPLVLFDNPDLTSNYTELQQHLTNILQIQGVNIRQKQTELARAQDLAQHGAATGREVLEAQTELAMEQTNLANERALLAEHETKLQLAGFNPAALKRARPGQAWLVCDVPESQVNKLRIGHTCTIRFTAYPDEAVQGRIESFGDVVDNVTRTIKLRINLANPQGRYRPGMFATVAFGISEGQAMAIPQTAIVTVQGKDYVFVAEPDAARPNRFERRPVGVSQQIGDRIVVFSGLRPGERVVTKGTIQLKGLSFGY